MTALDALPVFAGSRIITLFLVKALKERNLVDLTVTITFLVLDHAETVALLASYLVTVQTASDLSIA
jgi:hypothetical protein